MPYPKTSGQPRIADRLLGGAEAVDQLVTLHSTGKVHYFALNRQGTICPAAVLVCKLALAGPIKIRQTHDDSRTV